MNTPRDNSTPCVPAIGRWSLRTSVLGTGSLALALWMNASLAMAAQGAPGADAAPATTGAAAPAAGEAAPAASEPLHAVFIDVVGKVQWRASATDAWHEAQENDSVSAGVEVRTGLRSRSALRVGRNATILIDSGTVLTLPDVLQEGETLRTTAVVKSGRADFKVDHVGLTNDFRVVTPSTTLAVRGTYFAVASGPLMQVEVVGARSNAINAIELKYALNNSTVKMSRGAKSSSGVRNPAHAAVVAASAPTSATAAPSTTEKEVVETASSGPSPSQAGSSSQAVKSNRSDNKEQAIIGNVESSLSAKVQGDIDLANARTAQAIEYLMVVDGGQAAIAAQRDAVDALRGLATARRAAAMDALQRHQSALERSNLAESRTNGANGAFGELAGDFAGAMSSFDGNRTHAEDLLGSIQELLGDGKADWRQLMQLAREAHDALGGMNDSFKEAQELRDGMAASLSTVDSEIGALNAGVRTAAAQSIASYQSAVASLRTLVNSGASAAEVASASHAAVVRLQAMIADLARLAPTHAAMNAASRALSALSDASASLARAQTALAAIRAARENAGNDPRAAALGQVEQIYARIVQVRAALASQLLAANGLIANGDDWRTATNNFGADVLGGLGGNLAGQAQDGANTAAAGRAQVQAALAVANAAAADHAVALAGAESIASDLSGRNALAAAAGRDVGNSAAEMDAQSSSAEAAFARMLSAGSGQGMSSANDALAALQQMENTLLALTSRYADLTGALQGAPTAGELAPFQAAAAHAIESLLAAAANGDAGAGSAAGGAAHAGQTSGAAQELQSIAADLAERFGLSDALVSAAARAAAASAASAGGSASAAAAANMLVQQLAMIAHSDQMGQVAAQIDALLASNQHLSAQALHDLNAARAGYVATNEHGTQTFGTMTVRTSNDAAAQQSGVQANLAALSSMASSSTRYVAALDGAQTSANAAERALVSARGQRVIAEANEAATTGYFGRTQNALQHGDLGSAVSASNSAAQTAGAATQAAGSAAGHASTAATEAAKATTFGVAAERARIDVEKFGTNRQAFAAAAAANRQRVEAANAAMGSLKDQAQFYDAVAQMLSGRAGTAAARAAAAASGDAREQVFAIAVQLASSASDARTMEQTAGTNAGRMFGRSARLYVERAQAAALGAMTEAQRAALAAQRAETTADKAGTLVNGAMGGGKSPSMRR